MADKSHDSNGDHPNYADNFKRKSSSLENAPDRPENAEGENEESKVNQKAVEYVRELMAEKISMDPIKTPNAIRLIDAEIVKVQQMGRPTPKEFKFADIYREKPIKVCVNVLVPVREHPKFNFVGKLLGPKGNSLRRLQEETMCKMAILGKGSMKDRAKEEELRLSLDPKFSHLTDDLHVEISALGPPAEAHARVAFALAEVRKYLIPDSNDTIRQQQMREMEIMTVSQGEDMEAVPRRSILKPSMSRPPASPMRTATRTPVFSSRSVMPAKTKIMSILDRARVAMEESYGYEDSYESPPYEPQPYLPPSLASSSKPKYYPPSYDYEPEFYRPSTSSYGKYAEPSSSTHWTKSESAPESSRLSSESRYRSSPYPRPSKQC